MHFCLIFGEANNSPNTIECNPSDCVHLSSAAESMQSNTKLLSSVWFDLFD